MVAQRYTPTFARLGTKIGESEYADAVDAEVVGLWERSADNLGSVAGTNTITALAGATLTAYAEGNAFWLTPANTNTAATTLNVDGLGAKAIVSRANAALAGGELVAGTRYLLVYDGTSFRMESIDALSYTATWPSPTVNTRPIGGKFGDVRTTLDIIPPSLHSAILAQTSTTDVDTYIQDAITKADKGELWVYGKNRIAAQLLIRKGLLLRGMGKGHQHDVGSADYSSALVWTGAAGVKMARWEPVNGGSAQRISGGGSVGIGYYGEGVAGGGIEARSVSDGLWDVYAENCVKTVKTVTGVTKANPAVVTATAHGFANNDVVLFKSVGGMTQLNGHRYAIQNVTANTFELQGINSTGYGTYTSGGTAESYGYAFYLGITLGTLGEAKDAQNNHIWLHAKQSEISVNVGPCLFLDGGSLAFDGNASHNVIHHALLIHKYDAGAIYGCSDNNRTHHIRTFDFSGGGVLYGIELLGGSSASNVSGQNTFGKTMCVSGAGMIAWGTDVYPVAPTGNFVDGWDFGNSAPDLPVQGPGAELAYRVLGATGTTVPQENLGQAILAQKWMLYQSGNAKMGMGLAAGEMRLFRNSTASLRIGSISEGDGSTFTEDAKFDGSFANINTPARATNFMLGTAAAAGSQAPSMQYRITGVNFASANTDNPITLVPPAGFTRYRLIAVEVSGPSATMASSTFGLFTAAAGAGVAMIPSGTANTITTAADATNNNAQLVNGTNAATMTYTATTVYFRTQTASGGAATGNVTLLVQWLS